MPPGGVTDGTQDEQVEVLTDDRFREVFVVTWGGNSRGRCRSVALLRVFPDPRPGRGCSVTPALPKSVKSVSLPWSPVCRVRVW